MQVQLLGWEDPLEEEMATCSSILAWKIPWTEEPGGLHSPRGCKELDVTEHARTQRIRVDPNLSTYPDPLSPLGVRMFVLSIVY